MMDGSYGGMDGDWWLVMMVFWVVLIAGIVWVGVRLLTRSTSVDQPSGTGEQPQQILERRLAEGEIDVETYDALREKLRVTH
jgi:putative membrane protein